MPILQLHLLGAPQWLLDDAPFQGFDTRKAEALFIYLAVNRQAHRRDALTALFWPEIGEKYAKNNLRRTLSNLRALVGAYLSIDRQTLTFAGDAPYWLDVEQFTTRLAPLFVATARPALPAATVEEALAFYRADFLTGFLVRDAPLFEAWVSQQREHLHKLAVRALDHLTELYLQQRQFEAGLATTQRLLTLELWRETAHQQRMRLFSLTGQQVNALAQFESCRKILAQEVGAEPLPETIALYQQIKTGALYQPQKPPAYTATPESIIIAKNEATGVAVNKGAALVKSAFMERQRLATDAEAQSPAATEPAPTVQVNWGEMPRAAAFYGRDKELAQLQQWLLVDRCALVAILGVGGAGKTTLAAQLVRSLVTVEATTEPSVRPPAVCTVKHRHLPLPHRRIQERALTDAETATALPLPFAHIIWRSLLNAPPLTTLLPQWLTILTGYQQTMLPTTLTEQLALLFTQLRWQRCLLILDNIESLLAGETAAGIFRPDYAEYELLIKQMGELDHQSCLLLTSREQPLIAARLARDYPQVQSLALSGLPSAPAIKLLQAASLSGLPEQMTALVTRYSGNPLALKLITETVQELYAGDIDAFLAESLLVFDDIRHVLDQQFQRLSTVEQALLFCLAIAREPLSADQLQRKLLHPPTKRIFLEALRSLQRRSLLEMAEISPTAESKTDSPAFALQNVVTEYLIDLLLNRFTQEVTCAELDLFHHYGLVNAQAKEYIRATQTRLLLQPLLHHLVMRWGKSATPTKLTNLFQRLRVAPPPARSFAVANLLHLWLALGMDLAGYDFSQLPVREADLRGVRLPKANFANADLTGTVFTEIFNAVLSLAFSPDGQLLATAGADGVVHLWRVNDRQLIGVCPGNGRWLWSVCFSPDGQFLAAGCADRTVRLWEIALFRREGQAAAECQLYQTLTGHTDAVFAVCFSPDSRQIASAAADGAIRLWQIPSGRLQQTLVDHTDAVNALAYAPDGRTLASAGRDRCVRLWAVESGRCDRLLQAHAHEVKALAFHPDGQLLATVSYDQTIRLWQTATGQLYRTMQSETTELLCVAFHPDGKTVAVNDRDHVIRLWEINSGRISCTLLGHTNTIHALAFSPDGQSLVSGGWDKTIRFWDVPSGAALYTMQGYQNTIESIAIGTGAPTGCQYLANGNTDHLIHLWDTEQGRQLQTLHGHTGPVRAVAFHPHGNRLVSGSADRTLRLWQIDQTKSVLIQTIYGHSAEITAVAFSPDGSFFVSAGMDRIIRIWATATGRVQGVLRGHTSQINALTFALSPRKLPIS
jgi:WD40 repeat protein/DNA-binding SARP family transcriptional activator